MAEATCLKVSRGIAKVRTTVIGSAVVAMDALLSKFAFRLALKSSRGKSRSRSAISNKASLWLVAVWRRGLPCQRVFRICSTAEFSRSNSRVPGRERLGIGTLHLRPQLLQGTEL